MLSGISFSFICVSKIFCQVLILEPSNDMVQSTVQCIEDVSNAVRVLSLKGCPEEAETGNEHILHCKHLWCYIFTKSHSKIFQTTYPIMF